VILLLLAGAALATSTVVEWPLTEDDGGFSAYGETSQWQWGTVASGPQSGWAGEAAWATGLSRPYLNDTLDYLQLPSADLSGATRPVLRFYHWYEIDTGGDAGWVEVWDGASWSRLDPIYGYPTETGYSGNSDGWRPTWFDLSGVPDSADVRLAFSADDRVALAGWYVDEVAVLDGDPVPPSVQVASSPSDTQDLDGPYVVTAEVTDDQGSATATLYWETASDAGSSAMTQGEGDLFTGDIPGVSADTVVSWWIVATDGANETTEPEGDPESFRVYLAAPTDLAGPSGRIVGTTAVVSWTAPDSPHAVLSYRVYSDGAPVTSAQGTSAEAPLTSDAPQISVSAVYAEGEGDRSDPITLSAYIPEITSVEPSSAWQGETLRVGLHGTYLLLSEDDLSLDLGDDVSVDVVEIENADHAIFTLSVGEDAALGQRDGALRTNGVTLPLPEGFEVLSGDDRPRLLSVRPDALTQGQTTEIEIHANTALADAVDLDLGEGVIVESASVDGEVVTAKVAVAWDAPVGEREIHLDDGDRLLDGVDLRVRNAVTTPQRACSQGGGRPGAGLILLALGALLSRRGRASGASPGQSRRWRR